MFSVVDINQGLFLVSHIVIQKAGS